MRTLHVILTVWLLVGISWAKAPSSDWDVVEDIPTGWRIAVVTEFTFPCVFVRATAEEMVCESHSTDGTSATCQTLACAEIVFAKCESIDATVRMP